MIIRRLSLKSIHVVIASDFSFIVNLSSQKKRTAITQIMKTLRVHDVASITSIKEH